MLRCPSLSISDKEKITANEIKININPGILNDKHHILASKPCNVQLVRKTQYIMVQNGSSSNQQKPKLFEQCQAYPKFCKSRNDSLNYLLF